MEKKNTVLLTVIAIATLLVAVVGATFAYFATTVNTNEGYVSVVAETDPAASVFLATGAELPLGITTDDMKKAQAGNVISNTANLTVSFGSSKEGYESSCTYDLVFYWTDDSEAKYLPNTEGALAPTVGYDVDPNTGLEFTVTVGDGETEDTNDYEEDLILEGMAEKNIAYDTAPVCSDPQYKTSDTCIGDGITWDNTRMALVTGAKITSNSVYTTVAHCSDGSTKNEGECEGGDLEWIPVGGGTTVTWPITISFHNLNLDQNKLAGHQFKGRVEVTNVVC